MDMSSIVPSPATARDGRSKSKRAGKILQTMKMLDEAVTPKNDAMMSAIGSMPNQIVSTPANHLNVYDHSLFGSHLSTGQNLSMISEPNNTLLMEPTINLLELSTPTQMSMTDTTANFNYAMLENPGLEATASIFMDFKKCLSQHGMSCDIYDLISSYEEICDDYEQLLKKIMTQVTPENSAIVERLGKYLKEEKHTWRLVHSLFRDKFSNCSEEAMAVNDALVFYTSEKNIIDDYFDNDSDIRQAQIVIDWLERNAADELTNIADQLQHYTGCVTWENTLHHLKARKSRGTTTADGMILEMDPDAPTRTRKPLADLDREDESRLLKCVFSFIRGGRINEAEDLCVSHGQPWRAATLEGWKLHHDPNTVNTSEDGGLSTIEGNPSRDMWKAACWALSNNDLYDVKERAMYGALCGNLKAMLEVGGSWEDYVWSYYKTMVDVATEKRIQQSANIRRPWQHIHSMLLPDEYFLQKCELDDVRTVFEKIGHSPDKSIAEEAKNPNHFIQRCIILNDMDGLLDEILLWIDEESIHPQLLRFAAHLLLILQSFGMTLNYEKFAQILEAYVKQLISDGRAGHLVAAYTACLPADRQLDCYATFLETIEDGDLRKEYLELASEAGLDVTAITKNVVERIRAQGVPDTAPLQVSQGDDLTLEPPLTPGDHKKIDAIEWLVFDPAQRSEALKQSNAVIRGFLAARKFSAARQVFQKIPRDSVEIIHREWHAVADKDVPLPAGTDNAIREHICVQAYLSAQSTFSDWFKHFHNKPHEYEPAKQASTFASVSLSDLVAEEHRQKKQEEELGRWREVLEGLCFAALDKIYNVLLFPEGGWLVDVREDTEDNEENRCRHHQMSLLRRLYVPSLCDLLLNVLLNTGGRNDQCSKLADVIADEDNKLYELFTKQEGKRILERIQDAMVDIL